MISAKSWRRTIGSATPAARLILRCAVTLVAVAFLVAKLDVHGALVALGRIGWGAFVLAVVLLALSALLAAPRWHVLLRCYGVTLSLPGLVWLYLVGYFFNQVLPSSVGGDAVRIWYLKQNGVALGVAARSVVIDRLLGLGGMVIFVALGLPFMLGGPADGRVGLALAGIVAAAAAATVALAVVPRLRAVPVLQRPLQFLAALAGDFGTVLRTGALVPCLLLTFATSCLPILATSALGYALSIPVGFLAYAVVVPAALIISLAPISIAGWGVREAALVVCMVPYGVAPETALALSIAFGIAVTVSALPGGVIWFLGLARPFDAGPPAPRQ